MINISINESENLNKNLNKLILKKIFKLKDNNIFNIQTKIIDNFLQENYNFINFSIIKEIGINNKNYNLFEPFCFYNPKTNNILIFSINKIDNDYLLIFHFIFENNFSKDLLIIETLINILGLEEVTNYELYFKDYQKILLFTQYLNQYNLSISSKELELSKKIMNPDFINIINLIFNKSPIELNEKNLGYINELEEINFLRTLFIFTCSVKNEFIFQINNVSNLKSALTTFLCPHCKKPLKDEILETKFEISIFFEKFINNNIWIKNIILHYLLDNFPKDLKIYEYNKDILLININSVLFFIFIVNLNNTDLIDYFSYIKDMEVLNVTSAFFIINPISNDKLNNPKNTKINFPNLFLIYFDNINYDNFINKMNFIKKVINNKILEKNINEITFKFNINNYINNISLKTTETKEDILIFQQDLEKKEQQIELSITTDTQQKNVFILNIKEEEKKEEIILDITKDIDKILNENTNNKIVEKKQIENVFENILNQENNIEIQNKEIQQNLIQEKYLNSIQESNIKTTNIPLLSETPSETPSKTPSEITSEIQIEETVNKIISKTEEDIESITHKELKNELISLETNIELERKEEILESKIENINNNTNISNEDINTFIISQDINELVSIKPEITESQEIIESKKIYQEKQDKYQKVNDYINSILFNEIDIFNYLYSLNNIKLFNEIFNVFISLFSKLGKDNPTKVIQDTLEFAKSKNPLFKTFIVLYSNKLNILPKNEQFTSKLEFIFNNLFNIKNNIISKQFELLLIYNKFNLYSLSFISNLILGTSFIKNYEFNWNYINIENNEIFIKYKKEVIDYIINHFKEAEIQDFYILNKDWEILNVDLLNSTSKNKILKEIKSIYNLYNSCNLKDDKLMILGFKILDKYNLLMNFKNIIIVLKLDKLNVELISKVINKMVILDLV